MTFSSLVLQMVDAFSSTATATRVQQVNGVLALVLTALAGHLYLGARALLRPTALPIAAA